jgi:hypothetical protein
VAFFDSSLGMGSSVLFSSQPTGGSQSVGVRGSSSVSMGKELVVGGGRRTYMDVLGRTG